MPLFGRLILGLVLKIYPLFTLGKCLWQGASGAEHSNITNKYFKVNISGLKIPTDRRQASWLFTSVAEELNSGLP